MLFRASAGAGGTGGQYVVQGGMPDAHMPGQLDPAQLAIDDAGTALDPAPSQYLPSGIRGYRAQTPARGAAVEREGDFASGRRDLAADHLSYGEPDRRRTGDEPTGKPYGAYDPIDEPIPYVWHSDDEPVDLPESPPDRARAGSTGDRDPGRPAHTRVLAFVLRPFDQLIAQHPGPVDRVYEPAPFAARPRQFADPIPHAIASQGGHFGTDDAAGGLMAGPQRNTVRVLPQPWDEAVVNTGGSLDYADPGSAAQAGYKAAGWRAR